ncbi:hypothetical protein D3C87_2085990 [compost metagenome]
MPCRAVPASAAVDLRWNSVALRAAVFIIFCSSGVRLSQNFLDTAKISGEYTWPDSVMYFCTS